jgi:hypothetical protein
MFRSVTTSQGFDELCSDRAAVDGKRTRFNVAANGKIIEQAQILTTHNLATVAGLDPALPWSTLAERGFGTVLRLIAQVHNNPRPLGTIKNAAYAWRQVIFFVTLSGSPFVAYAEERLAAQPAHVRDRLAPVIAGLAHISDGGEFDRNGEGGSGRRFLGWTTERHWMLG